MDTKKVFLHLVKAARDSLHLESTLSNIGYSETPYFNLYGEIAEAIYDLLDEDTDTFEESATARILQETYTPDEISAEKLAVLFDNNTWSISDKIRPMLEEAATNRSLTTESLINVILGEWACKEQLMKAMTR